MRDWIGAPGPLARVTPADGGVAWVNLAHVVAITRGPGEQATTIHFDTLLDKLGRQYIAVIETPDEVLAGAIAPAAR